MLRLISTHFHTHMSPDTDAHPKPMGWGAYDSYYDTGGYGDDDLDTASYGLTQVDIAMDDKALDYHDCLLRVRDVALLTVGRGRGYCRLTPGFRR